MKKLISILLLISVLTLCLASCDVSKKDIVGTWRGEWEHNGNEFVATLQINYNGTFSTTTYKNGEFYYLHTGEYEIDGMDISCYYEERRAHAYTYSNGIIKNGDTPYYRIENT